MDINDFVLKFSEQLEETENEHINKYTEFRNLNSWDSLTGFAVLEFIKDDCNVSLTLDEFKTVSTIEDLFKLIEGKK